MTRRGAALAWTALLLATACTATDRTPPPSATTRSPSAAPTDASSGPAPPSPDVTTGLVPAIMLSSTIRTPAGQIRTGISPAATFVQTQGGFVVQDAAGEVYLVGVAGRSLIGTADPADGLLLVTDATRRYVAWVGTSSVTVFDTRRERLVVDKEVPSIDRVVRTLALADDAFYYADGSDRVVRAPYDDRTPTTRVVAGAGLLAGVAEGYLELVGPRGTRLVPLAGAGPERRLRRGARLSPSGRYAVSLRPRLSVRVAGTDRDVSPLVAPAPARQLVWFGPDRFTIELATVSLISPPDGDVWHLDVCRVSTRRCMSALTGVTGTALSIPGTPIRSRYGR
ncbi:MAG: hypothetical protein ACR2JD_02920 [Nocardioides sp.]